jgi:sortase A
MATTASAKRAKQPVKKPKKQVKKASVPKPVFSFRRNVMPPLVGLIAFILALAIINLQWITAEIAYDLNPSPALPSFAIDPSNTAASKTDPHLPPSIWIPAIGVRAPIIFGTSNNPNEIQDELEDGTVHYPTSAVPGQRSNVAIFGHSAGEPWEPGSYKFVFTLLDKIKPSDQIVITYKGTIYIYEVTDSEVVQPTDVSILNPTSSAELTLVTCSPVGTNQKRLVVHAQQVSPYPSQDSAAATPVVDTPTVLPGNPPSFWQSVTQLF